MALVRYRRNTENDILDLLRFRFKEPMLPLRETYTWLDPDVALRR